ncbi:MAG: PLP-dependent aminotransferase family protein [Geminicoccaceae bacterium]
MTITPDDLATLPGPRYLALAEAIAAAIRSGRLAEGAQLPTQRELAHRLGVTVGTVGRAYLLAEQRGLIAGEVGRGTFVRTAAPPARSLQIGDAADPAAVDLRVNAPSPTPVDAELTGAMAAFLAEPAALGLLRRYAPGPGLLRHREAAARWLTADGIPATAEGVVVTGGAQAGLGLALATLAEPGDSVLVEQLAYPGLREIAALLRLRLEGVAMDGHGLRPDALAESAAASGARTLVVTPTLQNPTTLVMPDARRSEVAAVCRRLGLRVVEDDVYAQLVEPRPAPFAALLPELTLHLASLSKCVLPGLRLGFCAGPPALAAAVGRAMHALRISESPLLAELFCRWLDTGLIARAIAAQRAEATRRQALARQVLAGLDLAAPSTGLHAWLRLPAGWRAGEAERACEAAGAFVASAELFWFGKGAAPAALRLALGRPESLELLGRGLATVAGVLGGRPAAPLPVI